MSERSAKLNIISIFGLIVNIIALEIVIYVLFKDPQTGTLFALGILIFVALYFVISFPIAILKQRFNQIKENSSSIFELKKGLNNINNKINMMMDAAKLDARLSFLEKGLLKMKKKGQIDPRWIIIIIIIILIILYLKSKG